MFYTEATDEFDLTPEFPAGQAPALHIGRSVTRTLTIAGIAFAAERIRNLGGDEDELDELEAAMGELAAARAAITRGLHDPRSSDIVWLERDNDGALALHVAQSHLGGVIRRTIVDTHRAVVLTSATLAVAGSFDFALDRFGIADVAEPC